MQLSVSVVRNRAGLAALCKTSLPPACEGLRADESDDHRRLVRTPPLLKHHLARLPHIRGSASVQEPSLRPADIPVRGNVLVCPGRHVDPEPSVRSRFLNRADRGWCVTISPPALSGQRTLSIDI